MVQSSVVTDLVEQACEEAHQKKEACCVQGMLGVADKDVTSATCNPSQCQPHNNTGEEIFSSRCLVPAFDGVVFSLEWKDALWDKTDTSYEATWDIAATIIELR